jgi:hypothetical protein
MSAWEDGEGLVVLVAISEWTVSAVDTPVEMAMSYRIEHRGLDVSPDVVTSGVRQALSYSEESLRSSSPTIAAMLLRLESNIEPKEAWNTLVHAMLVQLRSRSRYTEQSAIDIAICCVLVRALETHLIETANRLRKLHSSQPWMREQDGVLRVSMSFINMQDQQTYKVAWRSAVAALDRCAQLMHDFAIWKK